MGDDVIVAVTAVELRLENLDLAFRNLRAPQPPDELLALSAEHTASDDFYPAGVRAMLGYVHLLLRSVGPLLHSPPPAFAPTRRRSSGVAGRCAQVLQPKAVPPKRGARPRREGGRPSLAAAGASELIADCYARDRYSPVSVLTRTLSPVL